MFHELVIKNTPLEKEKTFLFSGKSLTCFYEETKLFTSNVCMGTYSRNVFRT